MKPRTVDRKKMLAAVEKMVEEKRMIQDHIAEGKDLAELESKGIKFVKPISL